LKLLSETRRRAEALWCRARSIVVSTNMTPAPRRRTAQSAAGQQKSLRNALDAIPSVLQGPKTCFVPETCKWPKTCRVPQSPRNAQSRSAGQRSAKLLSRAAPRSRWFAKSSTTRGYKTSSAFNEIDCCLKHRGAHRFVLGRQVEYELVPWLEHEFTALEIARSSASCAV